MRRVWMFLLAWLALSSCLYGDVRQTRIPLHEGNLRLHELNAALCQTLCLPTCPLGGEVNLSSPEGQEFLRAFNACLWRECSLTIDSQNATLRLASGEHAGRCESLRRMARLVTAEESPHATAAQARNWGLMLPAQLDPVKPIIILLHGLDSDRSDCMPMADLLSKSGYQTAFFSYPGEQPIADSADLLARSLRDFGIRFPKTPIDLVTHSMGGLVARDYIEGPDYAGAIDRLIMIAPPNAGSSWARFRSLLSIEENYQLRQWQPDWHWTWMITEGLGEAGGELLPGSEFLKELNSRPRRQGVRYTIIAGNHSGVCRVEGNCLDGLASWIPTRIRGWWGFRHCYRKLQNSAANLRDESGPSDGPVTLKSAHLKGVKDFVVLPADHASLYLPIDGQPPVAWPVVRDRLQR